MTGGIILNFGKNMGKKLIAGVFHVDWWQNDIAIIYSHVEEMEIKWLLENLKSKMQTSEKLIMLLIPLKTYLTSSASNGKIREKAN